MQSLGAEKSSLLAFVAVGIIVGAVSILLNNNILALVVAVLVAGGLTVALNKILKQNQKIMWYVSNGMGIYFFVWFITWTLFYNLVVI